MKKKGVVVRVHRESDRGGLFKAASPRRREAFKQKVFGGAGAGRKLAGPNSRGGGQECGGPRCAAGPDGVRPGTVQGARAPRASAWLSLPVRGRETAIALHRSLREYIPDGGLAGRRQRNAVVVAPGKYGEVMVSVVVPNIRAAFADREKNRSPAA